MSAEAQETRINDTVQELMFKFYPLAPILNNIRFKMSNKIPTAAVDASGRGLFNPDFAETLSDSELRFVIAHEALHVLLCHHKRSQKIEHVDNRLFNIAADCYINENLKTSTSYMAPEGLVDYELISKQLGEVYSYATMLEESTEDLYDRLAANGGGNNGGGTSGSGNGDKGDGDPGSSAGDGESEDGDDTSGSTSGDGSESESGSSSGSGNTLEGDIQQDEAIGEAYGDSSERESKQMEEAVEQADKRLDAGNGAGLGTGSGADFDIISKVLSVDASKILSRFTYKVSGRSTVCRSYRRPSRRYREIYPISAGKTRRAKRDVVFSIDVSSSMDAEKISKAVAFLVSLGREFTVGSKFMFFNGEHSDIYEFKSMEDFRNKLMASYGGGTSLDAALYDNKIDEVADGVVIISDMQFFEKISDGLLSDRVRCPYMLVGVDVADPSDLDVKRDNIVLF